MIRTVWQEFVYDYIAVPIVRRFSPVVTTALLRVLVTRGTCHVFNPIAGCLLFHVCVPLYDFTCFHKNYQLWCLLRVLRNSYMHCELCNVLFPCACHCFFLSMSDDSYSQLMSSFLIVPTLSCHRISSQHLISSYLIISSLIPSHPIPPSHPISSHLISSAVPLKVE